MRVLSVAIVISIMALRSIEAGAQRDPWPWKNVPRTPDVGWAMSSASTVTLIHPVRQILDKLSFSEADARVAKAAVDVIIQEIRSFRQKSQESRNSTA